MAVANIACPHCGEQTLATVPSSKHQVTKVTGSHAGWNTKAACQECGKTIYVSYTKS
ncbi:MAG: hypothetical protein ABEK01_01295 [Candidatus Nanohaloarchaea archaeon]